MSTVGDVTGTQTEASPDAAAPSREPSLAKRALVGSTWALTSQVGSQAFRFAGNLILTKLLAPEYFGVMFIASFFMVGVQMLSDFGLGPVVIRSKRGSDPIMLDTVWTVGVIRGVVLAILAAIISWPLTIYFFEQPILLWVLPIVAINAAILGLQSTYVYTVDRDLRQGAAAALELIPLVVSIVAMVAWAMIKPSVWALVAGGLIGSATKCILSHALSQRLPKWRLEPEALRELYVHGRWIMLSSIVGFFGAMGDRLILSKLLVLGVLGVCNVAFTIAAMPSQAMLALGWKVIFPALSIEHRDGDMRETYKRAKRVMVYAAGPALLGLAVAGPALVRVMYIPHYHAAGWMVRVLSIGIWFQVLETASYAAAMARGNMKWIMISNVARLVFAVACVLGGYHWLGLVGMFLGVAAADFAKYAATAIGAHRTGVPVFAEDIRMTATMAAFCGAGLAIEHLLTPLTEDYAPWIAAYIVCGTMLVWRRKDAEDWISQTKGSQDRRELDAPALA